MFFLKLQSNTDFTYFIFGEQSSTNEYCFCVYFTQLYWMGSQITIQIQIY